MELRPPPADRLLEVAFLAGFLAYVTWAPSALKALSGNPSCSHNRIPILCRQCVMAFNRTELIAEPVKVNAAELRRAINPEGSGNKSTESPEELYRPAR